MWLKMCDNDSDNLGEKFTPSEGDTDKQVHVCKWPQGTLEQENFPFLDCSSTNVMAYSPFLVDDGIPMELSALSPSESLLSNDVFGDIEIDGSTVLLAEKELPGYGNTGYGNTGYTEEYDSHFSEAGTSCVSSESTLKITAENLRPESQSFDVFSAKSRNENTSPQMGFQVYSRGNSMRDSSSKNAIAARDNRLKKKKYVAGLENSVKDLSAENERLTKEFGESKNEVALLKNEVAYLRSVIANQSTLSKLLKSVTQTPGISLTTSFECTVGPNDAGKRLMKKNSGSADLIHPSKSTQHGTSASDLISTNGRILRSSLKAEELLSHSQSSVKQCRKRKNVSCFKKFQKYSELDQNEFKPKNVHERNVIVDVEDSGSDTDSSDEPTSKDSKSVKPLKAVRGGICLHVSGENVSLEFCSHCSLSANSEIQSDHSYVKF